MLCIIQIMKERGLQSGFFVHNVRMSVDNPNYYRLSPFQLDIDRKLSPIKLRHNMYSNRKERPTKQKIVPETVLLNANQIDVLDQEYEKIKRSRHQPLPTRKTFYPTDALYKSLYLLKQKGLEHKYNRSYDHRLPTLGKLPETPWTQAPGSALN